MYERSKQHLDEPSLVPKSRLEMAPVRGKPRWPWVVGGAVLFLVASALIAYLSENGLPWVADQAEDAADIAQEAPAPGAPNRPPPCRTTAPASATSPAAAAANTAPASGAAATAAGGSAPFSSNAAAPAAPPPAAAAGTPAPQPGQVNLQLRFTADSWVEVFDGSGKAVLYDLGKAGSERTITAVAPVSVTLGDARGVGIVVNGRTLPPPPRASGETLARFSIGADGNVR